MRGTMSHNVSLPTQPMSEEHSPCNDPLPPQRGIYLISPSGAVQDPAALTLAQQRLAALGFPATLDACALQVHQRFAGTDEQRLGGIARALTQAHPIVMITRGGYGLSRLLPRIDWRAVADSGKAFVGFSDFTAFNLALLARTGAPSFTGPAALADFGSAHLQHETRDGFTTMMRGVREDLTFPAADADALDTQGVLWGGNLAMVASLLGTPYLPKVDGGILFLEDVNEAPYRIERMLTQLWQAGILERQNAIVLGQFTQTGHDSYDMDAVVRWLRATIKTPVVTGLPYGHVSIKATLPVGVRADIAAQGGMVTVRVDQRVLRARFPALADGQP